MSPIRWSAGLSVGWRPILTFARRRTALLEWLDENVDIAGFNDDPEQNDIGIAITRSQRLVLSRDGMQLELLDPEADGAALAEAIDGALSVLEPTNPLPRHYVAAWSVEIDGNHAERCKALARRATGLAEGSEAEATDCAVLADFNLPNIAAQAEFGIVSERELRFRLTNRQFGQIARMLPEPRSSAMLPETLPALSLFVDCSHRLLSRETTLTAEAILAVLGTAEAASRALVDSLQAAL